MRSNNKNGSVTTSRSTGFTLVELLIVIVIIAILAAVVVVAYSGIRQRAIESSLKSDLNGSAKKVELAKEQAGLTAYPATTDVTLAQSSGNTVTYSLKPYGYCLAAINGTQSYSLRSTSRQIEAGTCDINTTTVAGSGTSGTSDGTGPAAQFTSPNGIAVGKDGTIYVSDYRRIRKITPDGTVSLLAGSGTSGTANGTGASAQFMQPGKMIIDEAGFLYVVDEAGYMVRKINTSTGDVTTLTGISGQCNYSRGNLTDGPVSTARLDGPSSIAINSSGLFYLSEGKSNRVREIQPNGTVATYAGSGALNSCTANSAQSGDVNGPRLSAMFNSLGDITIGKDGSIYLIDVMNFAIKKISTGGIVSTIATSPQTMRTIAIDSQDTLYVTTAYGIYSVTQSGTFTLIAGSTSYGMVDGVGTAARFKDIGDIALDPSQTTLYIADRQNYSIRKIRL